jgi:hypothetical protein
MPTRKAEAEPDRPPANETRRQRIRPQTNECLPVGRSDQGYQSMSQGRLRFPPFRGKRHSRLRGGSVLAEASFANWPAGRLPGQRYPGRRGQPCHPITFVSADVRRLIPNSGK